MRKCQYIPFLAILLLSGCDDDGSFFGPGFQFGDPLPACTATTNALLAVTTAGPITFYREAEYIQGRAASITAMLPDSRHYLLQWQQHDGAPLELVTAQRQILAFEPQHPGEYRFSLTATPMPGQTTLKTLSAEITVQVIAAEPHQFNIRLDHQLSEGANASLRLEAPSEQKTQAVSWCQVSGPTVRVDLRDPARPLLQLPWVSQDERVHLKAIGTELADDAYLLITNEPAAPADALFEEPLSRVHPYLKASPYAQALQRCIYNNQLALRDCSLAELPLIGQSGRKANIDDIMARVLVSHDWMGDNFKLFLQQHDKHRDFIKLLQSVTAIVISYDIQPAFYWVATGAIYLNPDDLWLTPTQRDTINETPDFRNEFGSELHFLMPWRYVKDNRYASGIYDPEQRISRPTTALQTDLSSLLYHELAHANDFFPRTCHANLNEKTLYDAYLARHQDRLFASDRLEQSYPLLSTEMSALAEVRFLGQSATDDQRAFSPVDVSQFFTSDHANDFYAYSTKREDAAMLFEESMMSHRLGVQRDIGITNAPTDAAAQNVIVSWGERGRVGHEKLKPRAALIINHLLPELGGSHVIANLPAPLAMRVDTSWADNLILSPARLSTPEATILPPLQLSGDRHQLILD